MVLNRKPHLGHQPEFGGLLWVRKAGCQGQQLWLHLGWPSVADFALEIWGALTSWKVLGAAAEGAQGDRDTVGATCAILPEAQDPILSVPGILGLVLALLAKGFHACLLRASDLASPS